MKHKCNKCTYYYETKAKKATTFYNNLSEAYEAIYTDEMLSACGSTPGGVVLDKEAPVCGAYKEAV